MPIADITTGSPPNFITISGKPMPAVITGKAAKALPMIVVKIAMPNA